MKHVNNVIQTDAEWKRNQTEMAISGSPLIRLVGLKLTCRNPFERSGVRQVGLSLHKTKHEEETTMAKTVLEMSAERLNTYVADYNKAFLAKSLDGMKDAEENLTKELKAYKKAASDAVLSQLKGTENPVLEAVKRLTYGVFRTKMVKDDNGNERGIELVPTEARIDLVKVCEYCELPTVWRYKVEKLALLLALRAAKEIGIPAEEIKVMNYKFKMDELARKEKMGETPASNTQITKAIQMILDEVLPGLGKANAHDAAYMWMASTRAGREAKCIKVADAKMAHRLFAEVANRVVTNGRYSVDYKMEREKGSKPESTPATEEVKADENKTEAAA